MPAVFYPTYGYLKDDLWAVPARVWIYERRTLAEKMLMRVAESFVAGASGEMAHFGERIEDFLGDSKSRKRVAVTFPGDPEETTYRVQDPGGRIRATDRNGLVEGELLLPVEKARELLYLQGSGDGWLTCTASAKGHSCTGRIRLVGAEGLSIISDIDDTMKITDIPSGAQAMIMNTFFRPFISVPGMAESFRKMERASFHYVSGSPWQLYRPLAEFLFSEREGFPEGTFHMKNARKNPLSPDSWEDLRELVTHENLNYEQKLHQTAELMQRFPGRSFILVGDSGEKDPEAYRAAREAFPGRVKEIWIRDVTGEAAKNPGRFEGMRVIPVPSE